MTPASLCFLIIYNLLYYFLYLILLAFLIVTPIDLIQQAVPRRRNYDILIIALSYIVTVLVVGFTYAFRLYTNRSVLASIPKPWIPIDKGDVPRGVREMIAEALGRSAAIAYEARPRVHPIIPIQQPAAEGGGASATSTTPPAWLARPKKSHDRDGDEGIAINIAAHKPVWGEIEHPGWASPTSPDLPDLHYDAVVLELPHLIEAKALTLAPPDLESHVEPPLLDPDAVALLQRPECMGLREYLAHLTDLTVLAPLPVTSEFLVKYEAARFSARPLSNEQFRTLMHLFAEVLRNMHPLTRAALARYNDDDGEDDDGGGSFSSSGLGLSESDIDNDAPRGTSSSSSGTTARGLRAGGNGHGSIDMKRRASSSTDSSSQHRRRRLGPGLRNSSAHTWQQQFRTAPTTPRSRRTAFSRASSSDSFAQTRHPYPAGQTSSSSGASSLRSVGAGSVIRLAGNEDATDLPYVLTWSSSQ
ncbi:Defect at low temperature protein 1 [Madurella mycetomatis]|uniref:Defect at low temperature protein 1 n=1 Tax=Madurella mycetomatis TaxID=100816 RepID=A0A175W8N2_9PEZI|nr:Defect at low temperature protein 1 [Madurella mycetomatis]